MTKVDDFTVQWRLGPCIKSTIGCSNDRRYQLHWQASFFSRFTRYFSVSQLKRTKWPPLGGEKKPNRSSLLFHLYRCSRFTFFVTLTLFSMFDVRTRKIIKTGVVFVKVARKQTNAQQSAILIVVYATFTEKSSWFIAHNRCWTTLISRLTLGFIWHAHIAHR